MISTSKKILWKTLEAGVFFSTLVPSFAHAAPGDASCDTSNLTIQNGAKCSQSSESQPDNLFGDGGIFQTISNVLIFIVGAVAVLTLIFGGLQYVISTGDAKRVESAKNTILYSIIGIVVAILAYAVVGFVTGSLAPGGPASQ